MTPDTYDPAQNSYRSWELAIAAMREMWIRAGRMSPRKDNDQELRWTKEGPVDHAALDAVRE